MDDDHPETEIRDSNPNASGPSRAEGGMGVSSERTGPTGPGQDSTDGVRDVSPAPDPEDAPPEQRPGNPEENPDGLDPLPHEPERNPGHSHG